MYKDIMENVFDLIDEGYKTGQVLRICLRKNKLTLERLLQDNNEDREQMMMLKTKNKKTKTNQQRKDRQERIGRGCIPIKIRECLNCI